MTGVSTLPLTPGDSTSPHLPGPATGRRLLAGGLLIVGGENRLLAGMLAKWCRMLQSGSPVMALGWSRLPSPMLVVGSTGSGKTHIAEGLSQIAGSSALLTTAGDLRRDLADAIDRRMARRWRERWAATPLLVVDDLDHLTPNASFQQELLYLIDDLADRGHKLIATSARPMAHLRGWPAGIVSRFSAGLTVEIAPLDSESRKHVIGELAESRAWQLDDDGLDALTRHAPTKPRDLIAWMGRLEKRFAPRSRVTAAEVEEFVKTSKARSAPDLQQIVRLVSRYYGIPQKVLVSASRQAGAVAARGMVVYLARQLTTASYEQIAQRLGGRDHTTILHNYQRTCERLGEQPALRQASDELQALLRH